MWAHLEPILGELCETFPQITTLHFLSDGPVTQYRNKNNFYLLSTVPFLSGFTKVTWNYSEKSHGKGALDGIGGAIKREADLYVHRGGELQTPQDLYEMLNKRLGSSITHYWVSKESIKKCDELIPGSLEAVKGTFKIHQILSSQPAQITHREVSCFCKCSGMSPCPCYKPVTVDLKSIMRQCKNPPNPSPEDHFPLPPLEEECYPARPPCPPCYLAYQLRPLHCSFVLKVNLKALHIMALFTVSLYANNLLSFISNSITHLPTILNILEKFGKYSSYKLNFGKSNYLSINQEGDLLTQNLFQF